VRTARGGITVLLKLVSIALAALIFEGGGLAQGLPSRYPLSQPKIEKISMEDVYYFTVSNYEPRVRVLFVSPSTASYGTPEDAAVALISAVVSGEYQWWRSVYSQSANAVMDKDDKESSRTPEVWKQLWKERLSGKDAYLTTRIETGDYVIVAGVFIMPNDPEGQTVKMQVAFKHEGSRWFATQDLADDPVLMYSDNPDVKIKRVMRQVPGAKAKQ
jgi:hypothetical protein